MLYNDYKDNLLDKPSVIGRWCPVCGDYATDEHHVIQKGMGGVSKNLEKRIPKIKLCHQCHMEVHQKKLHLNYTDKWLWFKSGQQMSDQAAWELYKHHYSPLNMPTKYITFGAKK